MAEKVEGKGILTFLATKRDREELRTTLSVLTEFKECESEEEWAAIPFDAWAKLEQLEDFLRLLTGEDVEKVSDQIALDYFANLSSPQRQH